ncbi:unnamed protein product [Larinioides sclopetarius]|uniref:BTB domain-containing protein n=1 Tax=Larinioides sclopetarius TaxID=280406 RepID=A0AAV2BUA3_9ARAC
MDQYCPHHKFVYDDNAENYFFTWSIPEVSMINDFNISSGKFKMLNGGTYFASLCGSKDKMTFKITSSTSLLKCFVSIIIGTKTLLSKGLNSSPTYANPSYHYDLVTLSAGDESFQKLINNPSNSLTFNCKIVHRLKFSTTSMIKLHPGNTPMNSLNKLKAWTAVFRNCSESALKEKVLLRVGKETETVSKAILCARSNVFEKMFKNDTKEMKENVVTITDIRMPVLKILISFLYTGKLPYCNFNILCDLYYAADKYDVVELRQICVDLIIPQISMENIHRVMKLAFAHDDELLKSTVMARIAINIETWCSTNDWKNLINEEPKIAFEVLDFFDI